MSSFSSAQAVGCKCAVIIGVCTGRITPCLPGSSSLLVTSPGMEGGHKAVDLGEERMAWAFGALEMKAQLFPSIAWANFLVLYEVLKPRGKLRVFDPCGINW